MVKAWLSFCYDLSLNRNHQRKAQIMADQIHKRFSDSQIKALIESYLNKEIELSYILSILGIGRSRFFEILKTYRQNPQTFSIDYYRKSINRKISINNLELAVSGVPIRAYTSLRIVPDKQSGFSEVRFWYDDKLVGVRG